MDDIKDQKEKSPKTIIYCPSINRVAKLHEWLLGSLGGNAWTDSSNRVFSNRIVCQFHRSIDKDLEGAVMETFPKTDSVLRVLVATIAFGIGINIPDIERVIHWGLTDSVCHYWQEIGRCACKIPSGQAILYPVRLCVKENQLGQLVQQHLENPKCVRVTFLSQFVMDGIDCTILEQLSLRKTCDKDCDKSKCALCLCCSYCRTTCETAKVKNVFEHHEHVLDSIHDEPTE